MHTECCNGLVHLNPYGEYATLLAASLANDWPIDRNGIEARTRDFGMTKTFAKSAGDHEATRLVIDQWLPIVDAGSPEERAGLLNALMARAAAYPSLTDHNGEGWHLHYREDGDSLPETLRAVISVGTALHLTTRGMHRLGRCGKNDPPGDSCSAVVVDVTRNGRQRYCSVRCANRAAVRRHRNGSGPLSERVAP